MRKGFASLNLLRRSLLNATTLTALSGNSAVAASDSNTASRIDVCAFGAKADGVANDAPAINAAVQWLRDHQHALDLRHFAPKLVFSCGVYRVTDSIDLTGLQDANLVVDGNASVILGQCAGQPVIDALGTRWLTLRDLTIIGDRAAPPKLGLQLGRSRADVVADDHRLENVKIIGRFALTCLLNLAAETTGFDHVLLWNDQPSADSYCLIQDGLNHFGVAPNYGPAHEQDSSFNENEFINCDFRHGGGGVPVWLGDTARHRFIRCYAAGVGAAAFVVYCGPNGHSMLDVDCHCETGKLQNVFLLTGPTQRPVIHGFSYVDHGTFAARAVFACGPGVEHVTLQHARIEIAGFFGHECKVFDDPGHWTVVGSYYSAVAAPWNGDTCFTGSLLLGNEFRFLGGIAPQVPAGPTPRRPTGLAPADAGRLFFDTTLLRLVIWSGRDWRDPGGGIL